MMNIRFINQLNRFKDAAKLMEKIMATRSQTSFGTMFFALPRQARGLLRAWKRRREIGQLGELGDHMLADIGLTRQDLASALAEPLFVDASEVLAERARATHAGQRASALEAIQAERSGDRWAA